MYIQKNVYDINIYIHTKKKARNKHHIAEFVRQLQGGMDTDLKACGNKSPLSLSLSLCVCVCVHVCVCKPT